MDVIENLGATGDHFECIDLSDNEIIKLNNFPPLSRLNSLVGCHRPHAYRCVCTRLLCFYGRFQCCTRSQGLWPQHLCVSIQILCNNRVARIDADLCENIPNLVSLILTNNRVGLLSCASVFLHLYTLSIYIYFSFI